MPFAESILNLNTAIIVSIAIIVGASTAYQSRSNSWKSNAEAEKVRADRLQGEKDNLITENTALKLQNSKLAALPNLEKLYLQNNEILKELKKLADAAKKAAEK